MIFVIYILFLTLIFPSDFLKGRVFTSENVPIEGANVEILDTNYGTSTDKDGFFILNFNSNNLVVLKITHIAYYEEIIEISNTKDVDANNFNIFLLEKTLDFNDVVVTGLRRRTYIKDSPVLTHVITSQDIEGSVYNTVKDVLEMSMPNFQNSMWTHANFTSDRVKIQGLSDKYILFLIDGARVSGEFSGMLDFSMLNLSNVDRIEIVEGGMSSLYGSSAIGGVVNIITKNNLKPFSAEMSIMNDDPVVLSHNINLGLKYNNFSYSVDLINQQSDGYDLTLNDPVYSNPTGLYFNTLEKYDINSHAHKISLNFNSKYFLNLKYKKYIKNIFPLQKIEAAINTEPFWQSYDAPQHQSPISEDNRTGFTFKIEDINSSFLISYNKEEYIKSNFYFNYTSLKDENNNSICISAVDFCNNYEGLVEQEFINAIHDNESVNIQYDKKISNHYITFGFEQNKDSYHSFNIYKSTGDYGPSDNYSDIGAPTCDNPDWDPNDGFQGCVFVDWDHDGDGSDGTDGGTAPQPGIFESEPVINYEFEYGVCDYPGNYSVTDCESSSIFGSVDQTKYFKRKAFYLGDRWTLQNDDRINFSIRNVQSENYKDNAVYSFAYMLKKFQPYDIRFNYSRGFRIPSIKELYYNFLGHPPPIVGNPKLVPTTNDYYAISVDRRVFEHSYSVELFYNDVKNMIGQKTNIEDNEIQYNNFESVTIEGFNCHYDIRMNKKNKYKFVFNYTNPKSNNEEALELMSKYSFRMNYLHDIILDKLKISLNLKYSGKKFVFSGEKIWLDDFVMADVMFIATPLNYLEVKLGCKNILDYRDDRRFLDTEYLSSYDPGKRYVVQVKFKY